MKRPKRAFITISMCPECRLLTAKFVDEGVGDSFEVPNEDVGVLWACADYRETEQSLLKLYEGIDQEDADDWRPPDD